MDKHLLQILLIVLISALFGIMEKVKNHFTETWFSTIQNPAWLKRWLNPHERLIEKAPAIISWLLAHSFIAINDFWHFLKFVILQLIFILGWNRYEVDIWTWLLVSNFIYGSLFETFYTAVFNKRTVKQSMISIQDKAEKLFPMPKFTRWYLFKFPSRIYIFLGSYLVLSGVLLTAINAQRNVLSVITYTIASMMICFAVLHTIAFIKLRKVEKKRTEYLKSHL